MALQTQPAVFGGIIMHVAKRRIRYVVYAFSGTELWNTQQHGKFERRRNPRHACVLCFRILRVNWTSIKWTWTEPFEMNTKGRVSLKLRCL